MKLNKSSPPALGAVFSRSPDGEPWGIWTQGHESKDSFIIKANIIAEMSGYEKMLERHVSHTYAVYTDRNGLHLADVSSNGLYLAEVSSDVAGAFPLTLIHSEKLVGDLGLFMGHYQAPSLEPEDSYYCLNHKAPCEITTIKEDGPVERNSDGFVINREYTTVDVTSCCHGELAIMDPRNGEPTPCKLTLTMADEKHGICTGHYQVPTLKDKQSYYCTQHGEPCEKDVVVDNNLILRDKDGNILKREYSLVDVTSCCGSDLCIMNDDDDEYVPCELTLHAI